MTDTEIKTSIPGILCSNDNKTFVYCGRTDDGRTGHGVCLKSDSPSDIGKVAPGFKLAKFKPYNINSQPAEWERHIVNYKKLYSN